MPAYIRFLIYDTVSNALIRLVDPDSGASLGFTKVSKAKPSLAAAGVMVSMCSALLQDFERFGVTVHNVTVTNVKIPNTLAQESAYWHCT